MDDRNLLDALREGLPLTRRPFEAIGEACGASEDEVLEYLRRGCADGTLSDPAPLPPTHATASSVPAPGGFDQRLLEVVASGLPLLPTPYEAIAATLGATEAEVLDRLGELIDAGVVGRIRMHPRPVAQHRRGDSQSTGDSAS